MRANAPSSAPTVVTLVCDDLTPVSAFARLAQDQPYAFLLESVVGGEKVARYSFLGADPTLVFEARGTRVTLTDPRSGGARTVDADDPLALLEAELSGRRSGVVAGLPRFLGGAVGYAAYDAVRYYERLPHAPADDRGLPDLLFGIYDTMVIFDHARRTLMVVAQADAADVATPRGNRAARIEAIIERLGRPVPIRTIRLDDAPQGGERQRAGKMTAPPCDSPTGATPALPRREFSYESNFDQPAFESAVGRCKQYIAAGDVFQVVLSQRLRVRTAADPFDIYRALRVVNPSPFMFYLTSPQVTLVGASPEILCRVEDGVITNRPLAGTRRRGATPAEDEALRAELLADPKERAEHVMLVDLGRNDVGRVAAPGSVRVSDLMSVEQYSHVMHLSSQVTGRLAEGRTAFDALRAALPVGTVSGAPKVRAMQIIDELEPTRRGPYAGAVGYVDFNGNMDTCIALRTIVVRPAGGETAEGAATGGGAGTYIADIQAGAGIVADSVPRREYEETLSKAQALLAAIRVAQA